ncbi:cleavage stimulation factor subunit 2 isoform X2 [Bombina bombina]|uniref:cleavage stimulation factor subunit 2 isoform X2 n=1 Tax=Bombina bombina TaxID=8345 RepID=UPI00235A9E88|nr:cleavage stimulation factor subunit 2 isoform X2 [Bombina bombina]
MAGLGVRDPAVDRSLRSVFVGNIPYEATEEQLKDIFSEVGPVVSFRLVYDRETGKPKGYGFCEYQDQETALSAMRNLNGREFSGRALRVDNAASEKNKEELKSLGTGAPIIESPYGDPVAPEDAPESISRAVASLPPEQMFELMKQMKLCVQNSPQEARNMLLQNPQLAYALLQAQVVMRIVDPEIAVKILHRPTTVPTLIPASQQTVQGPSVPLNQPNVPVSQPQPGAGMHVNGAPPMMQNLSMQGGVPAPSPMVNPGQGPILQGGPMQPQVGMPTGPTIPMERAQVPIPDPRAPIQRGPPAPSIPPRGLLGDGPNDPRGGTLLTVTSDEQPPSRGYLAPPMQSGPPMHHERGPAPHDLRGAPIAEAPRAMMGDARGPPIMDPRGPPLDTRGARDPRAMEPRPMESRVPVPGPANRGPMPTIQGPGVPAIQGPGIQGPAGPAAQGSSGPQPQRQVPGIQPASAQGGFSPGQIQVTPQDHEKAALIMQVLQLTPDQIAMLPPEQRQSILILKEQIQKSTGAP